MEMTTMNKSRCQELCDALNAVESDYFAVYVQTSAKAHPKFLLHAHAKGKSDAMRIARQHGHNLPRWSFAVRVGKSGYFAALRKAFGASSV